MSSIAPIRIICISFILAVCLQAARGASLTGAASDPGGEPVPGASISLISSATGARWNTVTNMAGAYHFDGVPPGDYILRADATGFATFLAERVRLDAVSVRNQDVAFAIAGLHEDVVVTAASTPQGPLEVSKSTAVVDRSETENRDTPDLAAAVNLAPGVHAFELGGPGAFSEIRIRGLRSQDTAVLVDGLRLRDAAATEADASGLIEDFLLADDSRIEVLRGSGSSLYGTNAIGGVVNVITEEGGGRTRGSLLAEGGSLGLFRGRAQVAGGGRRDRFQYSLGLAQFYVADGVGGDLPYRDTAFQGSATTHLSPGILLTARLYGANAFGKLASSPDIIGTPPGTGIVGAVPGVTFVPAPDNPDYTRAGRFFTGALNLSVQPSAALNYSISYQAVASSRRYGDGPAGVGYQPPGSTRSLYDARIQTVNAHAGYRLGSHNLLSGGYEFENENLAYDNADFTNSLAASATSVAERSHALFAQDQVRLLGDRLQLSAAFRAQFFSLAEPAFAPAASAPFEGVSFPAPPAAYTGDGSAAYYLPKTGTKFRAHVGRGYRAPSLFERFGAGYDSTFGYFVYGTPQLAPEHSLSLDAGVEQTFARGRAKISATYFYTWLENVIEFDSSYHYANGRGGISRGVELAAAVSPIRSLTASAAYTFVNALERAPVVGDTIQSFVIPRNQFSILATERITARLEMTFDALASGSYLAPIFGETVTQVYRFGGLHRLDLGGSYRLPLAEYRALRFFVRVNNLLDQAYYESGFPAPGRTGKAGVQFEF
jgi:iron complex outermembrane receptor protein